MYFTECDEILELAIYYPRRVHLHISKKYIIQKYLPKVNT